MSVASAGKPGGALRRVMPPAGPFPPRERGESSPRTRKGYAASVRLPHRLRRPRSQQLRKGCGPPDPPGEAAVRRTGVANVDSRCRLGRFVRNSGASHASCSRGNSAPEASDLVPTRAAMAACVCASGFPAREPLVQLEPFRSPGAGMPLPVILRPGTGRRIRTLTGEADSSLCSE